MYLMICTSPDIAFAVGRLSQLMEGPTAGLSTCVRRVVRFVKQIPTHAIIFKGQICKLTPVEHCDADRVGCKTSGVATSRYVFLAAEKQFLGNQRRRLLFKLQPRTQITWR